MKKYLYILITIIIMPVISFCHPASDVQLQYDIEKQEIVVVISHSVRNPNDHYIYDIEVLLNNKKIVKQSAYSQINNKEQKFVYLIHGLKYNDKIKIIADCNKGGKIKRSFVIEKTE